MSSLVHATVRCKTGFVYFFISFVIIVPIVVPTRKVCYLCSVVHITFTGHLLSNSDICSWHLPRRENNIFTRCFRYFISLSWMYVTYLTFETCKYVHDSAHGNVKIARRDYLIRAHISTYGKILHHLRVTF